jgi:hypothetical protein
MGGLVATILTWLAILLADIRVVQCLLGIWIFQKSAVVARHLEDNTPMNLRSCVLLLTLFPVIAFAAGYKSAELSGDGAGVVITSVDGSQFDAPSVPDQVAFSSPRVSGDGRHVGWLALFPNCCTSYPVELLLVVLDESRHMHTFDGTKMAMFGWCFPAKVGTVAYAQGVLHGSDFRNFELRRISDGVLVAHYEFPHDEADNDLARKRAPGWVRCVPE